MFKRKKEPKYDAVYFDGTNAPEIHKFCVDHYINVSSSHASQHIDPEDPFSGFSVIHITYRVPCYDPDKDLDVEVELSPGCYLVVDLLTGKLEIYKKADFKEYFDEQCFELLVDV